MGKEENIQRSLWADTDAHNQAHAHTLTCVRTRSCRKGDLGQSVAQLPVRDGLGNAVLRGRGMDQMALGDLSTPKTVWKDVPTRTTLGGDHRDSPARQSGPLGKTGPPADPLMLPISSANPLHASP